ncbi:MAG: hypothetical protein Fur003_1640 [Candidatus Dojkabacteria bacterium]
MPKLSVVIPTYNEELFLPKLLDSLCKQTFKEFEIIVSDKSTDKTKEVAESYKDRLDIKVVSPTQGRGVSRQRNYGATFAKAELLLFLDADDVLFEFALEYLLKKYEKYNFDLASCWHRPANHIPVDWTGIYMYNFYAEARNNLSPTFSGQFFFIKKQAFNKVGGFDENSSFAEDFDLSIRAFKAGYKPKFIRKHLFKMSDRRIKKEGRLKYYAMHAWNGVLFALPKDKGKKHLKPYELEGYDELVRKGKIKIKNS